MYDFKLVQVDRPSFLYYYKLTAVCRGKKKDYHILCIRRNNSWKF